jgi:hypothetical protein
MQFKDDAADTDNQQSIPDETAHYNQLKQETTVDTDNHSRHHNKPLQPKNTTFIQSI